MSNWAAALAYWREHSVHELSKSNALEIGCNYGGLSLWLASQGASVTCTDLHGPRSEAIEKHRRHAVEDRIKYDAVNALDIPYSNAFDVVVFKSILGVIGEPCTKETQAAAIRQIHQALTPGGELYFAENLAASPLHRSLRRKFVGWGAAWRYPSIGEMREYLSVFSDVKFTTFGVVGAFGRSEMQRTILASVDRALLNRIVPAGWKYVIAGIARK